MRGLIYCVHLSGVGHLKRMLTLAEGLVKECEITFIQAGRDERITFFHPNFHHFGVPILKAELAKNFRDDYLQFDVMMKRRKKQLFSLLDFTRPYDFIITEQMPFTKSVFLNEAHSIMQAMKVLNPRLAMICSQKGGTVFSPKEKKSDKFIQAQKKIVSHLQSYYDKVLVHCDPQITTLEEMFNYCDDIRDLIEYTGYIYPRLDKYPPSKEREKTILVTTGSGSKGILLISSLLEVVPKIPDFRFVVVTTSMMRRSFIDRINNEAEKLPNLEVVDFLDNFDEKLRQSSLAITLGGSTLINLYATGTPGLVFPEPLDKGQVLLAGKFAEHGIVQIIQEERLAPEKLNHLIVEILKNPPKSDIELNIGGVENSLKAIREVVKKKRAGP